MFPVFESASITVDSGSYQSIEALGMKPVRSSNDMIISSGNRSSDSLENLLPKPIPSRSSDSSNSVLHPTGPDMVEQDSIEIEVGNVNSVMEGRIYQQISTLPPLAPEHSGSELDTPKNVPPPAVGLPNAQGHFNGPHANRFSPLQFASKVFGWKKSSSNSEMDRKVAYIVVQFSALQDFKP